MSRPIPVFIVPPPSDAGGGIIFLVGLGIISYLVFLFEKPPENFPSYPSLFFAWIYHYTLYKPVVFLLTLIGTVWDFFKHLTSFSNLNTFLAIIFTGITIALEFALIIYSGVVFYFYAIIGFVWFLIWFVLFLFN